MVEKTKTLLVAALALAVPLALGVGSTGAAIQYLGDGARQNANGGWDLPTQGTCPTDPNQITRPDCLALRIVAASSGACTTALGSWTTSGVCNDLVNASQVACEARPDRLWNAGTGVCAVAMKGDDRNRVVCANHGGTWVTTGTCTGNWVLPDASTYIPPLFTGTTNPGPGDQCLRCHNNVTEYNGPRLRDTNWALRQGHKNMARMVVPGNGMPWAGPAYECTVPGHANRADCEANGGTWEKALVIYPSDDGGNLFDWANGQINIGGTARDLVWIYGDWLAPLPRAMAKLPASTSQVCSDPRYTTSTCVANGGALLNNAGAAYSCARCHTTGWTSDATINAAKHPEVDFPGLTWDRNSNAGFGVVNLSGSVSGDANKYASWDVYGISCPRCHSSAVDNTTNGGVPPFSAPAGMSSHHSNLTVPDFPAGCSLSSCGGSRCTSSNCPTSGGVWSYGYCTDPRFLVSGIPFAAAKAACETGGGLGEPAPGMGLGVWFTPCSDNQYGTQAACQAAGATWTLGTSSCSVAGVCNIGTCSDPSYLNRNECEANGGIWAGFGTQSACQTAGGQWAATSDIISCEDAGGHWTGTVTQRGQIITALCMNCHRQETAGLPYDANSPAGSLKVGPAHGTVSFVSHPHGNQYLNSPHGKFSGSFPQIASGKFNYAMTGEYKSFFMIDGEAGNTGNGCTGCHDVHKSVVEEAFEPAPSQEGAIKEECTACHNKNLILVMHPQGAGTPLEEMVAEPFETCVSCHMPEGTHLWRINVDPNYSTWSSSALTTTVNANTAPQGSYTNAVWVDLDHACGQCHGGGTVQAATTGSITSGSKILSVASTTGFAAGQKIQVADAGALGYDDQGLGRGDFESYIVSVVSPGTINLAGAASLTVVGKQVTQNPTRNGAGYMTKAALADLAKGMHNDKPMVTFGYTLGSPNTLVVSVDASASTCSGDIANCDAFEWDWGDASPAGTSATASHTYAAAGTYAITLTVEEYGVGGAVMTRNVAVYTPDYPPTADGTCTFNSDTWTQTVVDSSTDDNGVSQVTVNWGDGSVIGNDTAAPFGPFTHTYFNAGTYTVTHKALDTIGQQSSRTCTVSPEYFSIGGTVNNSSGSPVPSAMVTVKKGITLIRTVYTAADGTFSAGFLKPGTYTLTIVKTGYTFTVPAATLTVGPSSTGNLIQSMAPTATGSKGSSRSPVVQDAKP